MGHEGSQGSVEQPVLDALGHEDPAGGNSGASAPGADDEQAVGMGTQSLEDAKVALSLHTPAPDQLDGSLGL
jgi:hypothetical protein